MKRILGLLIFACMSVSVSLAGYSDGYITAGEYEGAVTWTNSNQPLIVDGGGAADIEMRNYSRLEVRSTSTPLGLLVGGIQYIALKNNSHLDYYDGETFNLMLYDNTTANLYGGRIDYLTSFQYTASQRINIYALPGWSWISDDPLEGIQGQWWDESPFQMKFDNIEGRAPVWMNVNVIVPEPTTLLLMTVGCVVIRKKKPRIRPISRNLINSSSRAFYRVTMKASVMFLVFSSAVSFAGYSDGWITAGEYEGHVRWTNSNQPLIVDGGGAIGIEMRNHSQLEVRSTSTPLGLGSGIQVIGLNDYSHLDYRNGETFNLMLYGNATADLYGGRIDYLTSFQYAATTHVNIYALPGWSWISDDPLLGIQGQWWDGSPFDIKFDNKEYRGYDPVWMNVNVIVPEPASLLLMAAGLVLVRKR